MPPIQSLVRFVAATGLILASASAALAGCNPSTQDIADCVSVPPASRQQQGYSGGGAGYRSGGSVYSGGGGTNYGAALGAAAGILGALGDLMDSGEEGDAPQTYVQPDANDALRRAQAARDRQCRDNWAQGSAAVRQGNDVFNHWNPGGAIPSYERAITLFNRCGDSRNAGIARRNLDAARRQYAAIRDDNRVAEAYAKFGRGSPYTAGFNPFDNAAPAEQPVAALALAPGAVLDQAAQKCAYAAEGSTERKRCMTAEEGRAIMAADPGIKAACGLESNVEARGACAVNAYIRNIQQAAAKAGDENCYFRKDGSPCYPGGGGASGNAKPGESLRERLRRQLAAKQPAQDANLEAEGSAGGGNDASKQQTPGIAKADVTPPAPSNDDDPLANYLRSRNAAGGLNDGDLGAGHLNGLTPLPLGD